MVIMRLGPRCGRLFGVAAITPLRLGQAFIWNIYELNWSMNFKLFCWCQSDARRWLLWCFSCAIEIDLLRWAHIDRHSYRCRCCRHNRLTFSSPTDIASVVKQIVRIVHTTIAPHRMSFVLRFSFPLRNGFWPFLPFHHSGRNINKLDLDCG